MNYEQYKIDFLQTLRNESAISGSDTEDEFINHTLDVLTEFDEIQDPVRINMGDKKGKNGRIMSIDGYSFDETEHSLILFISDFQDSLETEKLTMGRVDELYWRLYYFIDEAVNGKIDEYFDDSDDVIGVSNYLKRRINANLDSSEQVLKIKFYILTNKELDTKLMNANLLETTIKKRKGTRKTKTTKKIKKQDFNQKPLEINLWYLERIYEMEESNNNDPIVIDIQNDFPQLGLKGIPCLKGDIGENLGYEAYIAIISGKLLSEIYIEYGSKVLEGNVRAFLGTSGSKSVNSGIKRTINNEPNKFFTYNNGIATTASDVEIEKIDGELFITKIVDLQIINGGQTTASLADAVLKKRNVELKDVYVPMKLTVIEDRETETEEGISSYDAMVKAIAKYANSQNKVTAADLFSNDPFHVWMEKMSKKHLAPPTSHSPVPTGWYYERSRKKYQQEQVKLKTKADVKRFTTKFPKKQVITKEQLAMYITAIHCKPDVVSKGKNWVMKEFSKTITTEYKANREVFNEFYFKKCVCAAIIFRSVDFYLESNKDSARRPTGFWYKTGGYKLNIVPYTIAKILSCIPSDMSLDWDYIWREQKLSSAFMREIEIVTKMTNDFICDSHGVIVTEYCKKQATWDEYKKVPYKPSANFMNELVSLNFMKEQEESAAKDQKENNDLKKVMDIISLGNIYWKSLLRKGILNNLLSYQEQLVLKKIIEMASTGSIPATSSSGKVPYKTMSMINNAISIKEKLEAEGVK